MSGASAPNPPASAADRPGVAELVSYFIQLGTTGFGGPIALVGYMQRDLTEHRRWFTPAEFSQGLAFAQLAPGPLAAQLAIYLGWLRAGSLGATLVGAAFVAPSLVMVVLLAIVYERYQADWLQGALYGIGAAVIALIARSTVRLARVTLQRDGLWWAIFGVNAVATLWTGAELLSVLLLSGVAAVLVRAPPAGFGRSSSAFAVVILPNLLLFASSSLLLQLFVFFAKAGAVVFGSGLAIVPFLHGAVVDHHWITEQQFLDAVAVSLVTPGPVVITVAFIGHLVAGLPGALVAAIGVFLPVYVMVVVFAPFFDGLSQRPRVRIAVGAFAAAATGALAGAAFILARRALLDVFTVLIAVLTLLLLLRFRKLPEPLLILGAGVAGVMAKRLA
jgi:chromate transporter